MFRLVYVSAASNLFEKPALLELLTQAREKNHRLGVTGMLLYKNGDFIQLLEGEEAVVKALYHTISDDPRHTGSIVLIEEHTDVRLFNDWSMGFRDLGDPEIQATPGYSAFLNTPLAAGSFENDPSGCLELFALFKNRF